MLYALLSGMKKVPEMGTAYALFLSHVSANGTIQQPVQKGLGRRHCINQAAVSRQTLCRPRRPQAGSKSAPNPPQIFPATPHTVKAGTT